MKEWGAAPCQCASPGGHYSVWPGWATTFSPPRDWSHAVPCVTCRVWPRACECQAVRAPACAPIDNLSASP